jgi:hypothetical protein
MGNTETEALSALSLAASIGSWHKPTKRPLRRQGLFSYLLIFLAAF